MTKSKKTQQEFLLSGLIETLPIWAELQMSSELVGGLPIIRYMDR
jgi:hypothetical protein